MELDLKAFSLTVATGLAFAAVVYFALLATQETSLRWLQAKLERIPIGSKLPAAVFLTIVFLSLGIIVEDLSKNAVADRAPNILAPTFQAVLPQEKYLRSAVLATQPAWYSSINAASCLRFRHVQTEGDNAAADDVNSTNAIQSTDGAKGPVVPNTDTDAADAELVLVELSDVGLRLQTVLDEILANGLATPLEISVGEDLHAILSKGRVADDKKLLDIQKKAARVERNNGQTFYLMTCKDIEKFERVYYLAKNVVYRDANYFKELEDLYERIAFERSLCFVLLAGTYLIAFLYLANCMRDMWREVGKSKTFVSVLLFGAISLAVVDVTVWLADSSDICARGSNCAATVTYLRIWALPAVFMFVCCYRTRRVWKRIYERFAESKDAFARVHSGSLLPYMRENEARHALVTFIVFALLLAPIESAFESDEWNYDTRVIAYYEVIRGTALSCKPGVGSSQCRSSGVASGKD